MAEFTAKDVQKLRQATDAGMMDAKRALEANDGDMERAAQWLREKGLAKVAKLPDVAGPLEAQGGRMIGSTPAQLQKLILDEIARWNKVVAESNIKLEQ